jgi:hypothetical protein
MYPLPIDEIKQACSAARSSINTSNRIIKQVIRRNNLLSSQESVSRSVCDASQQAKSHQLPYSNSMSASKFPLELVYFDVRGPALESVGRKKYYISFIGDFSKFTWIYLIKFKSEVFQKFQALVERQFNDKILPVQTDWGWGEYQKLNPFFTKFGISYHVSCPHTHQQNGSVKHKHHHRVKIGLSLLAYAFMPLKFWDKTFLAAAYLINRLPSKVIHDSTSLERLFDQKPDYSLLRVF